MTQNIGNINSGAAVMTPFQLPDFGAANSSDGSIQAGGIEIPYQEIYVEIASSSAVIGSVMPFRPDDQVAPVAGQPYRMKKVRPNGGTNGLLVCGHWCVALEAGSAGDVIRACLTGVVPALVYAGSGSTLGANVYLTPGAGSEDSLVDIANGTAKRAYGFTGSALSGLANNDAGAVLRTIVFNGVGFANFAT